MTQRILLYADYLSHTGAGRYDRAILTGLAQRGFAACCARPPESVEWKAELEALGVTFFELGYDVIAEFQRTTADRAEPARIFDLARPDLILFGNSCPLSHLAAKAVAIARRIPYVIVEHLVEEDQVQHGVATFREAIAQGYREAAAAIAVSQANLSLLQAHFDVLRDKGQVVYCGRPEEFFLPTSATVREALRQRIGVPTEAVLFVTAAQLHPRKGYQYQLAAMEALRRTQFWPAIYFAWAGQGPIANDLVKALREKGLTDRVRLLGRQPHMADWLGAADAFLLPSRGEGMPLSISEAMAKGLPVIASAVSGIPEQLDDTGWLIADPVCDERQTVRELAEAIATLTVMPKLRRQMGQAAKARAERLFREDRMVAQTIAILKAHLPPARAIAAATPPLQVPTSEPLPQKSAEEGPAVAIVVTQRERFSYTQASLESLYASTTYPFHLVYVEANSPPEVKCYLVEQAQQRGFELVSCDRYLTGNAARNLALARVRGAKYIAFVENDLLFQPGWLEAMVRCAEETGAALVTPLIYDGPFFHNTIHVAGGAAEIHEVNGKRHLHEEQRYAGLTCDRVVLQREPTALAEAHCLLLSAEALAALPTLAPGILDDACEFSHLTYINIGMVLRQHGYGVYFEPAARVAYVRGFPLKTEDAPLFAWHWEATTIAATQRYTRQLWQLADDDPNLTEKQRWLEFYRSLADITVPAIAPLALAAGESRPFWSVMVPVRDRAEFLETALRSVLAQDPGTAEMQIDVVDDGSSPEAAAAIAAIVARVGQGRIGYVRLPEPVGQPQIFNACLQRARGAWIHLLHDDDWVKPGFYDRLRAGIAAHPEVGVACCRYALVDDRDRPVGTMAAERETPGILEDWAERIGTFCRTQFVATVVARRAYEDVGGFCDRMATAADWEMWKRLACHYPTWYEPEVLACYRQSERAASSGSIATGQRLRNSAATLPLARAYYPRGLADRVTVAARERLALSGMGLAQQLLQQNDERGAIANLREGLRAGDTPPLRRALVQFLRQIPLPLPMPQPSESVGESAASLALR